MRYCEFTRLKRKEVSNRKISEIMNRSRNTVNRIVRIMVKKGLGWDDLEDLSDHELGSIFEVNQSISHPNYVVPDNAKSVI